MNLFIRKVFQKIFGSNELKSIFKMLDGADHEFESKAFKEIVRPKIEKLILSNPKKVKQAVKEVPPREWTYGIIANICGDLLESGKYHIYRGVLAGDFDGGGSGKDLLKIFDKSIDELVKLGNITNEFAEKQKSQLRKNIKKVG